MNADVTYTGTWNVSGDIRLCLNGRRIQSSETSTVSIIKVSGGGELTLTDCKGTGMITRGSNANSDAVYVENGGTLNFYGGKITQNNNGGVENAGTFNMYGGTISENGKGNTFFGGVTNRGTFNMYGGTITGNTSTSGGGVYNYGNGIVNMKGGTISGNQSTSTTGGGGGVYNAGKFYMSGGSITGNTAVNGGGVKNQNVFVMSGGSITGNNAASGGGIYNDDYQYSDSRKLVSVTGTITLKGTSSKISGNNASAFGGGVYQNGSAFSITDNAGVYGNVVGGTLTNGVYTGGSDNNVYLPYGKYINADYRITGTVKTGVSVERRPNKENNSALFSTRTSVRTFGEKYMSDDTAYEVFYDDYWECFSLRLASASVTAVPQGAESLIYNGGEQQLLQIAGTAIGGTMQYSLDGTNYSATVPTGKAAETYTVYYKVVGDNDHSDSAVNTLSVTIAPQEVTIAGVDATGRPYEQGNTTVELAGGQVNGKIGSDDVTAVLTDAVGTMATDSAGLNKDVTVSGAKLGGEAAGNYQLSGQPTGVKVDIARAEPTYTLPTELTATAGQTLASVTLPTNWSWMNSAQKVGDASETTKTFKARFTPNDTNNYLVKEDVAVQVLVTAAGTGEEGGDSESGTTSASVTTAPQGAANLTYNGADQQLLQSENAGTASNGTIQYSLNGETYSTELPTGREARTYTVYYKAVGNDGYSDSAVSILPVTIAPKEVTITGVQGTDRPYERGNKTVGLTGGQVTGKIDGDDVTAVLTNAVGTMETDSADSNKDVTVSYAALGGTAAGNYKLREQPTGVKVNITRAEPVYTVPAALTATAGQTLASVTLPANWSWMDSTQGVGDASETAKIFKAKFTPDDTANYIVKQNIDVPVLVKTTGTSDSGTENEGTGGTDDSGINDSGTGGSGTGGKHHHYNALAKTENKDNTKAPETADPGVAIYGVLSILSLVGLGYTGKRKF